MKKKYDCVATVSIPKLLSVLLNFAERLKAHGPKTSPGKQVSQIQNNFFYM